MFDRDFILTIMPKKSEYFRGKCEPRTVQNDLIQTDMTSTHTQTQSNTRTQKQISNNKNEII